MDIRVRYPPSPTGMQHIGGLRTALFNYLFAKSQGGTFVLRIEDTDRERYDERALQDIYDTFDWVGFRWDEGPDVGGPYGPYIQSERGELYRKHAQWLLEQGLAYEAFDSAEALKAEREAAGQEGVRKGYDRKFRDMSEGEKQQFRDEGIAPVIRFKVPLEGTTEYDDLLLGRIKRKNKDIIPDPVLLKSDGMPTYHLANVVDDHHMQISHILRGQEWVPTASLHVLLYDAFGWEPPQFCHLPMVMGKDGQKLSKRHGATSVLEFRNQGYLPEALVNYLARLGWSYDDSREFFRLEDLRQLFDPAKLTKSPAVFDYKKLEWFNGSYIRARSQEEVKELVMPFLEAAGLISQPPTEQEDEILQGALPIIHERLKRLCDAPDLLRFIFEAVDSWDMERLTPKKMEASDVPELLRTARELLEGFTDLPDEEIEERFRAAAEEKGIKLGALLMPLRVAVTGSTASPPLFASMKLLGAQKTFERLDACIMFAEEQVGSTGPR